MMDEWKKCPNGHYYLGEGTCPYCVPPERDERKTSNHLVKVCSNRHVYNSELNLCPICASTIVNDEYDWRHDTIDVRYIHLLGSVDIIVDGKNCYGIKYICVHMSRGNKHFYCFSKGDAFRENEICIEPDGVIQIGESTMKGRELIKICDMILDNHLSFMVHNRFSTTIEVSTNGLIPL